MPWIEHAGKRILFIHIPKTGGRSIEQWMTTLSPLRLLSIGVPNPLRVTPQHLRGQDICQLFQPDDFDHVFTVVRDPYKRIESEYRMRWILGQESFFGDVPHFNLWFEQAMEGLARNPNHMDNHLRPMWEFLGDRVEVFRFEDGLLNGGPGGQRPAGHRAAGQPAAHQRVKRLQGRTHLGHPAARGDETALRRGF